MAMETNELIDVQELTPFKKFVMSIGAIPTSYLESMSYAELLMWFCNYLQNTIIPTVNNNGDAVEELQGLFVTLHNYVEDYFENLNVQEEIDNKLDQMAYDGDLTVLMERFMIPVQEEFESEVNSTLTGYNNRILGVESELNSIASGSPLTASSTSGMTDTTKVYVNTTDGKWYFYDGDSWEIGGTYQASEIADGSVTPPKTNFLESHISTNLLDTSNLTEGYYIPDWTKTPQAQAGINYYKPTNFVAGESYTISRVSTSISGHIMFSCFNGNTNVGFFDVIPSANNNNKVTITIPATTTDVYINIYDSAIDNAYVNHGTDVLPYEPYYSNYIIDTDVIYMGDYGNKYKITSVKKDGTGDFTTLTQAVAAAQNGDVILVFPGNYENEEVQGWGKNISIIGINKEQTIISNNLCDYNSPPIEFGAGLLKNLTFISKYNESNFNLHATKSYALHIEDNNLYNKKLLVENCSLISEVSYGLGMGMRGGCNVEFNNCIIEGYYSGSLFFHDADDPLYNGVQNAHFINCRLLTNTASTTFSGVRIDTQDVDGSTINVEFIDNVNVNIQNGIVNHRFRNGRTDVTYDSIDNMPNFNLTYSSFGNNDTSLNK